MAIARSLEKGKTRKKIGLGLLSLLLFLIGLLFSISLGKYDAPGDYILRFIGLKAWSNGATGLHYTLYYSFIFFIPALIIGHTFKDDWGAQLGRMLSLILIIPLLLLSLLFITF